MSGYTFVRFVGGVVAKLLFRVEYIGRENEPAEGGFIAFSNHTTFFDPIFTACAIKQPLYFIGKSDLMKNGFMRWLFNACNVVPINRGESDIAALRKTCDIIKEGKNVGIYPGGTRKPCDAPVPEDALAGVGLIASRTKASLVPVTICYGKRQKPKPFRKVRVYVGKPIPYEEYSTINERPSSHDIAEYSYSKLCEDFAKYNG